MTETEIKQLAEECIHSNNNTFETDAVREYLEDAEIEYTSDDVKAIHLMMYRANIEVTW